MCRQVGRETRAAPDGRRGGGQKPKLLVRQKGDDDEGGSWSEGDQGFLVLFPTQIRQWAIPQHTLLGRHSSQEEGSLGFG